MIKKSNNPSQTKRLGKLLAKKILKKKQKREALVLALVGELGSGKTTFLQGFARGLGIKEKINSPTFVIIKRFDHFYHIDCYRIKKVKELLSLGFKKIISNHQNIVAIEWADRVKKIMLKETIWINFKFINNKTRKIVIQ